MEEFIKNTLYTGIGIFAVTVEETEKRFRSMTEEVDTQLRLSEEKGKEIVDEFMSNVEKRRDEVRDTIEGKRNQIEGKVAEATNELVSKLDTLPKKEEVEQLSKTVEELEAKVAAGTKPAPKTRAKRSTVKKTTPAAKK